jgi:hypothetical protein
MISEKRFLEYKLEMERRFNAMDKKIDELKNALSTQELRHKLEMEKLLRSKEVDASKTPMPTEDEIAKRNKQASVLLQYSEDPETLKNLGFNITGGNDE